MPTTPHRTRRMDDAVLLIGGLLAAFISVPYWVTGPVFTTFSFWQWPTVITATMLFISGAPSRLFRRALALSVTGSVASFVMLRLFRLRYGGSGLVVYPRLGRSGGDTGLTVAVLLLLAPALVVSVFVLIDLPGVAATRALRRRTMVGLAAACAAAATIGAAATAIEAAGDRSEPLLWAVVPISFAAATFALTMAWRVWASKLPPVTPTTRVFVCASLLLLTLALPGWFNEELRVDYLQYLVASMLPVTTTAIMIHDFWGLGRARLIPRLLEAHDSPADLEKVLRSAFGDPNLRLLLDVGDSGSLVDVAGREVDASDRDDAELRPVLTRGTRIAAIQFGFHTKDSLRDAEALLGVATLAIEKARLQAQVLAQMNDLTDSRRRMVEATDRARRVVERDLHDGAQQRLATLALSLRIAARDSLTDEAAALADTTAEELTRAVAELQDLARGIHPAMLTDHGLRAGVEALVERAPFPITTDVTDARHSQAIELTAYFVVAEALANAAKHADASAADVQIRRWGDALVVSVADTGRGGADASLGSGLAGLADRCAALGGTIEVRSPVGGGTTVVAVIPVEQQR